MPAARSYVLVDVGTGNVLAGYNERVPLPPASLTKVLTALIAVTYLPPSAMVTATQSTENVYPNRVGMEVGKPWPLSDVLHALIIMSANDAAYAIAGRISGQVSAFGSVMQRSAAQIGMTDHPVFHDPAGLDASMGIDGGNEASARDLAIAGRDLLSVPELAKIADEDTYYFVDPEGKPHWLPGTNHFFLAGYPGAIGIKTGFTDAAGACVMEAARKHGRTMLAVVLNGYNPNETAIDLLNQGFATPVNAEPTADHLPEVTLPYRPLPVRFQARKAAPGRGAASQARAAASKVEPGPPQVRRGHSGRAARGGFGAVAGSWPGRLLLMISGLAAMYAWFEAARGARARRRRAVLQPYGQDQASTLTKTYGRPLGLLKSRRARRSSHRRRQRLLDGYRRQEELSRSSRR